MELWICWDLDKGQNEDKPPLQAVEVGKRVVIAKT